MHRRLIVAAALWAAAAAPAGAEPGAAVEAVRLAASGPETRLELDLTHALEPKAFTLGAPKPRVVVDLPARFALPTQAPEGGEGEGVGGVLRYRYADRGGGFTRLVLDLAEPGRIAALEVTARETGGARLTVRVAPLAPAAAPAPAPPPRRVVVIDPGHGGKDPGAIGVAGSYEKDINLAAGLALRDELERRGHRVVMTREGDQFLELADRVRLARQAQADLFISLHSDAAENREAAGASVYTLSERGGARAKSLAPSQNWQIDVPESPHSASVETILLDLTQRDTKNRSADFAQTVIRRLSPATPLLRNTHRNAGFFVLLAPDVPAILLEMGFLTNAADERRLGDANARKALAASLAEAVDDFFTQSQTVAQAAAEG